MGKYILSTCSTADMPKEFFLNRDIHYACFHYEIDGKEYLDDLGESMDLNDFYQKMQDGAMTKTSQINEQEYEQYFEPFLKNGQDILHLTLSSGISGTVNSARLAADALQEKYPDRRIYVEDSLAASSGMALLMDKLADLRDQGRDIEYVHEYVRQNKLRVNHWFFSGDLTYLIRGGRVSRTAGFVGKVLNICPLLNVDVEGHLIPRKKIRTKKKAIQELVEQMEALADGGLDYCGKCFISNSYCYEDARAVADLVEDRFKKLNGKVQISTIGTTIGSHTGPGTVALFFWGKERTD